MLDNETDLAWLSLIDPVGLSAEKGWNRSKQFFSIDGQPYLDANHSLHRELIESFPQWIHRSLRSPENALYGMRGVSLGNASKDLDANAQALIDNHVGVRVYAAGASEFDTVPGAIVAVKSLEDKGVNAELKVIEHASHAITMSAGMYALALCDYINQN